jgi:biotin carboxyl carrier protein
MATRESSASGTAAATRYRDHEAIGRLADELLPALIAKLTSSGLGEIEIRESGWKARLRKPAGRDESFRAPVRVADHAGHGHAGRALGAVPDDLTAAGDAVDQAPDYLAVISPAVGVFHPRKDLVAGMNVRAGDRVGYVDVLGVHEDVVSPVNGLIGSSLVETGEAVEYGQELIRVEPPDQPPPVGARATREPSATGRP